MGEGKPCLLLLDNNIWHCEPSFLDKEREMEMGGGACNMH
jgi:hypothetical protein